MFQGRNISHIHIKQIFGKIPMQFFHNCEKAEFHCKFTEKKNKNFFLLGQENAHKVSQLIVRVVRNKA